MPSAKRSRDTSVTPCITGWSPRAPLISTMRSRVQNTTASPTPVDIRFSRSPLPGPDELLAVVRGAVKR